MVSKGHCFVKSCICNQPTRRRPTDTERLTWLLRATRRATIGDETLNYVCGDPTRHEIDRLMREEAKLADIDLRAEVLAGIDREIEYVRDYTSMTPATVARTALRHLREQTEQHQPRQWRHIRYTMQRCRLCGFAWPCPTLLSLAPDYAPQALAQIEADRG